MATVAADTIEFIPDEEIEFIPDPEPIEFIPDEPDQAAIQSDAMRATQQVMGAVELMGAPTRFANDAVREMGRLQQRAQELDLEANAAIQGQGEFTSPQVQNIAQGYRAVATQERQRAEEIANRLRAEAPEIVQRPTPGAPTGNDAVDRINWMGRGLGQIASTVGLDPLADTLERAGRSPMGLNFQANIGPAAGGAAGAALMTIPGGQALGTRLLTPLIVETTAPIAGAITGSVAGGAAQETIQRQAETPEQTAQRHETLAETQREFPLQSMIGQSAANTPFFRPSIRVIGEAMSGNRTAQAMVGSAAAIGGVMGAMPAVVGGQPLSLGQIAQGALENVLLNRPTRLGRAIGLPDPISTQPRTTNAQQISPASAPDGGVLQSQVAPENAPLPTPQGGEGIPPSRQGESLAQGAPEAPREVNQQDSKISENIFPTDDLTSRTSDPVSGSQVTRVKKTTNDRGETVYAISYERDGVKYLGYSDNPVWEFHSTFGSETPTTTTLEQGTPETSRDIDPLQQIRPAIKVGDQTIVGESGQTHREILDGFIEQNPEAAADALVNFDTKENPNLFVGPEGELNRTQLKAKYGVSDSQGLAELQQKEASAAPLEPATTPEVTEPTSEVSAKVEAQEAVAIAESEPIGIRNALVEPRRAQAGLAELETAAVRSYGKLWEDTKVLVQQDPQAGRRLVEELTSNPRPVTDEQDSLLLHELGTRDAELVNAMEAVNNARTPEESDAAQLRFAEAQNAYDAVSRVTKSAGTANARGLAARRMLINRDFSLTRMMQRYRTEINGGAPLSKNQQDQVIAANQRIKELETRLSDTEDKLAVAEAQNIFTDLKRTARKEATATKRRSVVDFLADQEAKARQRIISRRGRLNVTVDPLNIAGLVDEAIIGAAKIARGVRDFTAWSKEMLEEFGDRIRPQLQALFNRSGQIESENSAILTGQEPAAPVAALDQKAIFDRARQLVNEGATDLAPVMQQITRELQAQDPNITERQVRDIFSGYGKVTTPSKEADLTQLRELRNLARLTSQLEDAQRGLTPLKSGPQRDKATARVRELQKQVSVAMRKAGLDTADPTTQIASAHQARVTRLKNAIEETQKNIADRKRTERPEPIPWTPEEIALREQLDELKTRLDDTLNEPDSAMLDRISKRIADVTLKIQSGDIAPTPRPQGPPTKAVSEAQAELTRLNKELAAMRKAKRDAEDPPMTPDQRKEASLLNRRDELLDAVAKGNLAIRSARPTAPTQRQAELRAEIESLNKRIAQMRKDAEPQKPADQTQFQLLQKRITDLQERINRGETDPRTGRPTVPTQRVSEAREQLAKLNEQMAEMRRAAAPKKPVDEAQFQALQKRLDAAKIALASGSIEPKSGTPTAATERVTRARAELAEVNRQIRELRNSSEELRLSGDKKRIATQIKKLQDRVSANDYAPRKVREAVLDKEKLELQFKLAEEKRKWNEGFLKEKLSRRTAAEKARDFTAETINTSRAILTSADVSAPLRQGGFIFLGNPVRGARTLGTMFKALVSEKQAFKVMRDIDSRPNAPLYEASGLYLARDGNDLRAMEEAYASRWAQRIPLVRASQRAYTTFLNKLRADTFDALHAQLGAATPLENKALANYINAATGRGKYGLQSLENSGQLMNTVFFAPRYVASRFQLLAGQPLMQGTNRTRVLIAKEYAKYLAGIATVYALGSLAGATIEKDPRSSDFGKLRFGQTRLDPLSGISQVTTLVSRLATGQTKNQKGRIKSLTSGKFGESSRAEVATRFLRTKLSPAIGAIVDLAAGENVVGEKVTPGQVALRSVVPISFQEIEKHMEAQGVPRGTALFILSLFGAGLQTYDTKR